MPESEMGWRLTVALVAGWQNKVGDSQGGDERRKRTMNNLRAMPRDLGTFVFPVIRIPRKAVALTGSLSSNGGGPLAVTAFSGGWVRARAGAWMRRRMCNGLWLQKAELGRDGGG